MPNRGGRKQYSKDVTKEGVSKKEVKDKKKKDHKKDVVKNTNQKPADFTIITGLGEKMAQFLQDQGVHTYKQLSTLTTEKLEELRATKGLWNNMKTHDKKMSSYSRILKNREGGSIHDLGLDVSTSQACWHMNWFHIKLTHSSL